MKRYASLYSGIYPLLIYPSVSLLLLALAGCASTPRGGHQTRPSLQVIPHPRMAFGPLRAEFDAWLVGGDDVEDFHCVRTEWDFGDGAGGSHEADCQPWTPGTRIERHFTVSHCFKTVGDLPVKLTLWRANRKLAVATTTITILWRAGGGLC